MNNSDKDEKILKSCLKNITDILNDTSSTFKENNVATVFKNLEETKVDNEDRTEDIKELTSLKSSEIKIPIESSLVMNGDEKSTETQNLNKNSGIKFHIFGDDGLITKFDNDKTPVKNNTTTMRTKFFLKYVSDEVTAKEEVTSVTDVVDEANNSEQKVTTDRDVNELVRATENTQEVESSVEDNLDDSNNLKVRLIKDLDELQTVIIGNATVVKENVVTETSPGEKTVNISNKTFVNVEQLKPTVSNIVNTKEEAVVQLNNKVDKLEDKENKNSTELFFKLKWK